MELQDLRSCSRCGFESLRVRSRSTGEFDRSCSVCGFRVSYRIRDLESFEFDFFLEAPLGAVWFLFEDEVVLEGSYASEAELEDFRSFVQRAGGGSGRGFFTYRKDGVFVSEDVVSGLVSVVGED